MQTHTYLRAVSIRHSQKTIVFWYLKRIEYTTVTQLIAKNILIEVILDDAVYVFFDTLSRQGEY